MYTKSEQRQILKQQSLYERTQKIIEMFNCIQKIGECLTDKIHIIDVSEEGNEVYRIYHAEGYCIDFYREPEYDCETDEYIQDHYNFHQHFEGFKQAEEKFIFNDLLSQIKSANTL